MSLQDMLKKELKKVDSDKKTISVVLENAKVNALDNIVKGFNRINPEKTFTRQRLIEIAIDNLIQESNALLEEHQIPMIDEVEEVGTEEYDTVIFPAQWEGFDEVFLGENQWYHVRLGKERIDKIKYIACYVGAPVSAITHYARVKSMKQVNVDGKKKYIIFFDGDPVQLAREIPIGDAPSMSVRANRYVRLEDLLSAETYEDLL